MSLTKLLQEIRKDLIGWQETGLNESQTIQVIVLPILSALGWNTRNPFEVYPQKNSGGGAGGFVPDFTLIQDNQEKLLVEAKSLGANLSAHRAQAVNYANSVGHRWVVLTNGQEWEVLDNALQVPAQEKLFVTIQTSDEKADHYLEQVMSEAFWSKANARELLPKRLNQISLDIRNRLKLSEIENKLKNEIRDGFTYDIKGLKKAIELTLEANERDLANHQFEELAARILGHARNTSLSDRGSHHYASPGEANVLGTAKPAVPGIRGNRSTEDVISILRSCMKLVSGNAGSHSSDFEARILGELVETRSWRDFHSGLAEAFLKLGRKEELEQITKTYSTNRERLKGKGAPYPESAFRKLSNGRWLYVHLSAEAHADISNSLLKTLSVPTKSISIKYRSKTIHLPT